MKLYSYWRSSASYRVRIALGLKGLDAQIIPVNLLKGEQKSDAYRKINPLMRVPCLIDGDRVVSQSLAIMEYLDEIAPDWPLLPVFPEDRVRVREIALLISTDIAPLNNIGTTQLLGENGFSEEQKKQWMQHWMKNGFAALEAMIAGHKGDFCHGDSPTMADCVLVPQLYSAKRFEVDLTPYPTLRRIDATCALLPAFKAAHPDNQPDKA
jgi:maleylacetoacetate isomerase